MNTKHAIILMVIMMKETQLIYFDVDGTLLNNKSRSIPEGTLSSLKKLKSLGYALALCTGRTIADIAIVKDLVEWDGYVLANGSTVYDKQLNLIHEVKHDEGFIQEFLNACKGPLLLEGDAIHLSSTPSPRAIEAQMHFYGDLVVPIKAYEGEAIHNIICYDMDTLDPEFKKHVYDHYDVVFDVLGNSEIIHPLSGKHNGCQKLNEFLGITHYTGFGDGENDVEYLKNAHYSIGMGNATESVKQVVDYVTSSVEDEGILKALIAHKIFD